MSLVVRYSDPRGLEEPTVQVALGSNIRYGTLGLAMSAELGDPAMSTVELDDPGGILNIVGLRALDFRETSAPSNNTVIVRGAIQDREVHRDPSKSSIVGADRIWSVDMTDYNWHLGKRILVDGDANRPAETPGDRIRWLLHQAAHISLNDYGHVTYPTTPTLEPNDYRGQRASDLLADCAVEGQYNFWCDFNEAHGTPELFFHDPNNAADTYAATISISNVLTDVDSTLTFAPSEDATLRRSPSRIAYGVYLPWSNGAVYVRKDSTADQFGGLDQSAPMANVKSAARATRIANRFLNDNDEETARTSPATRRHRSCAFSGARLRRTRRADGITTASGWRCPRSILRPRSVAAAAGTSRARPSRGSSGRTPTAVSATSPRSPARTTWARTSAAGAPRTIRAGSRSWRAPRRGGPSGRPSP